LERNRLFFSKGEKVTIKATLDNLYSNLYNVLKCLAGRPKDFVTIAAVLADIPQRVNLQRINAVLKKSKIMPPVHQRKLRELLDAIKR